MNELEELNLLNQLIELGAKAAHAHAQSNSDDGHKGTAAWAQWHELRAEMGELVRAAYAPQADSQPVPVPTRAFLERTLAAMEGVIDVADRQTDEFEALRSCVIDLTVLLFSKSAPARDYPPLPMQFACSGVFPVYSADQMRAYVDADRAARAPADSVTAPAYSIDADPQGIRARVADAITGALAFGAQGANPPPTGHWLVPFWETAREEASRNRPVSSDTLYLLRRLLSNQHTLTGSEFREELTEIVGEATQAADSVLEDAARWQALEACVIEINGGKDWMSIFLKDDAKPEHFLKGLLADKLAALAARKQGGA